MLSNKPVLPNFVKVLCFAFAATVSGSAFAGHHEEAEQKIGDLKDMSVSAEQDGHLKKDKMKHSRELSEDEIKAKMGEASSHKNDMQSDMKSDMKSDMHNDMKESMDETKEAMPE